MMQLRPFGQVGGWLAVSMLALLYSTHVLATSDVQVDTLLSPTTSGVISPQNGTGITEIVGETHGKLAGSNLFFSFSKFNLPDATDHARFDCAANNCGTAQPINNVIARVNAFGDQGASTLNGIISFGSKLSNNNANFWFFNPQGVVVGSSASIDLPASVHIGNATQLTFNSGPAFDLATTNVSSLNANPASFGFVGVDPDGAGPKATVSPSGVVQLNGTGPSSTAQIVTHNDGQLEINASRVELNDATLTAAGTMRIVGDQLVVESNSTTTLNSGGTLSIQERALGSGFTQNIEVAAATTTTLTNAAELTLTANAGITNKAEFTGNLNASQGNIVNDGDLTGTTTATLGSVTNNTGKTITGEVTAGNHLTNNGTINGDATAANQLSNTGRITGAAEATTGNLDNLASGQIQGNATAGNMLSNSGTINGKATANNAGSVTNANALTNNTTGIILSGAESLGSGDVLNKGRVEGAVNAGRNLTNEGRIESSGPQVGNAVALTGNLNNQARATIAGDATAAKDLSNNGAINGKATANTSGSISNAVALTNGTTGVIEAGAESAHAGDLLNQGRIVGNATAGHSLTNSGSIESSGLLIGHATATDGSLTNLAGASIAGDATAGSDLGNAGTINGKAVANNQSGLSNLVSLNNAGSGVILGGAEAKSATDLVNEGHITGLAKAGRNLINQGTIHTSGLLVGDATAQFGDLTNASGQRIEGSASAGGAIVNNGSIGVDANAGGTLINNQSIGRHATAATDLTNNGSIQGNATATNGNLLNGAGQTITGSATAGAQLTNAADASILAGAQAGTGLINDGLIQGNAQTTAGDLLNKSNREITGNAHAGGNLSNQANATIRGNARADNDLFNDGLIQGNATATLGNLTNADSRTIEETASAGGQLNNANNARILADAHAGSGLINDGFIQGNAQTEHGDLLNKAGRNIAGNASAGDNLTNEADGLIDGSALAGNDLINRGTIQGNATATAGQLINEPGRRIVGSAQAGGLLDNQVGAFILNGALAGSGLINDGLIQGNAQTTTGNLINRIGREITGNANAGGNVSNETDALIRGDVVADHEVSNEGTILRNATATHGNLNNGIGRTIRGTARAGAVLTNASNGQILAGAFAATGLSNDGLIRGNAQTSSGDLINLTDREITGNASAGGNLLNSSNARIGGTAQAGLDLTNDGSITEDARAVSGNLFNRANRQIAGNASAGLDLLNEVNARISGRASAAANLHNAGQIDGNAQASLDLINTGSINGSVMVGHTLTNHSFIGGSAHAADIVNQLLAQIDLDVQASASINNAGLLGGAAQAGSDLSNSGDIATNARAGGNLDNSGRIGGTASATGNLQNVGRITGNALASGNLTNSGTLLAAADTRRQLFNSGSIAANASADGQLTNTGYIIGSVQAHDLSNQIGGVINGNAQILASVLNLGQIDGQVHAGTSLFNNGLIGSGAVAGVNLNNSGIITGNVSAKNDAENGETGLITGNVKTGRDLINRGKLVLSGATDRAIQVSRNMTVDAGLIQFDNTGDALAQVGGNLLMDNSATMQFANSGRAEVHVQGDLKLGGDGSASITRTGNSVEDFIVDPVDPNSQFVVQNANSAIMDLRGNQALMKVLSANDISLLNGAKIQRLGSNNGRLVLLADQLLMAQSNINSDGLLDMGQESQPLVVVFAGTGSRITSVGDFGVDGQVFYTLPANGPFGNSIGSFNGSLFIAPDNLKSIQTNPFNVGLANSGPISTVTSPGSNLFFNGYRSNQPGNIQGAMVSVVSKPLAIPSIVQDACSEGSSLEVRQSTGVTPVLADLLAFSVFPDGALPTVLQPVFRTEPLTLAANHASSRPGCHQG